MAEIHVLNVGQGDCIIFKSNKGHVSIFDICGGNLPYDEQTEQIESLLKAVALKGNYQMCKHPTNPIKFLKEQLRPSEIFRFILSHPDMDHMDGFNNLFDEYNVLNFWDSGIRKQKPDFSENKYDEQDWDRYVKVRDKQERITIVYPRAGSKGKYYNMDDGGGGGDFVSIYAPNKELIDAANDNGDMNDGSYVLVYRSAGGRILLPGDAHDKTWEFVLENYSDELVETEFLVPPHHGRDSNRSWDFLDVMEPKFSVLGCAASKDLAYQAWNNRALEKITQNQAGNIAIYPDSNGLSVYVENDKFAEAYGGDVSNKDGYGNVYLTYIEKSDSY